MDLAETHQTYKGETSPVILFSKVLSDVQEVGVFEDEQQECEDDTASEEKEGTHKLVDVQGVARIPFLVLWLAYSLQPEALEALDVTCKEKQYFVSNKILTVHTKIYVKLTMPF